MPVSTRSRTELKPVSKEEWNAVEALLFMKNKAPPTPPSTKTAKPHRPHRASATYTPGTFAGMEE